MRRKSRKIIGLFVAFLVALIAFGSLVSIPKDADDSGSPSVDFCVIYDGKKFLQNVKSIEIVPENAVFVVQSLDGEPIEDYEVAVYASSPKTNFTLTFDSNDTYDWNNTFVATEYRFDSAGIEKNGSTFRIHNAALSKILAAEYVDMTVDCSAESIVNALRIDVTVDRATLSISYYSYASMTGLYFSEDNLVC